MSVDPRSDRPIYRQVADILRAHIEDGTLAPGAMLPSEKTLAETYGVGRDAARQALSVLRNDGLIRTTRGERSRVRESVSRNPLRLQAGERALARMPTPLERAELGLNDGTPIVTVIDRDGSSRNYSADEVFLEADPPVQQ